MLKLAIVSLSQSSTKTQPHGAAGGLQWTSERMCVG
jgi:hypothetical protein